MCGTEVIADQRLKMALCFSKLVKVGMLLPHWHVATVSVASDSAQGSGGNHASRQKTSRIDKIVISDIIMFGATIDI